MPIKDHAPGNHKEIQEGTNRENWAEVAFNYAEKLGRGSSPLKEQNLEGQ